MLSPKLISIVMLLPLVTACGYKSRGNELTGQVKKITHETPLLCPNRWDVDISLGVMRNGVGSVSTEDIWLTLDDSSLVEPFTKAMQDGAIVRVHYDTYRFTLCQARGNATKVTVE